MGHPLRRMGVVVLSAIALHRGVGAGASASVPADHQARLRDQGQRDLTAPRGMPSSTRPASKLGDSPTEKQVKAFVLAVFIPNVTRSDRSHPQARLPGGRQGRVDATLKAALHGPC